MILEHPSETLPSVSNAPSGISASSFHQRAPGTLQVVERRAARPGRPIPRSEFLIGALADCGEAPLPGGKATHRLRRPQPAIACLAASAACCRPRGSSASGWQSHPPAAPVAACRCELISLGICISPDAARTVQSERDFRRNACNGLESHMRADKKLPYMSSRSDAGRAERAQPGRPFGVPEPPYCRWEGAGRPLERPAPLSPHPRRCPPQVRRTTGWICVLVRPHREYGESLHHHRRPIPASLRLDVARLADRRNHT